MIDSTILAAVYRILGPLSIVTLLLAKASAAERSYVLLRSSNKTETVQSGIVTEDPRGYMIELTSDSKAWVPRNRVQFVGKSLQEVYAFRCRRISVWGSGDHLEMARWCLRHDLIEEASQHFLKIPERYHDRPQIRQVGQEIKSKLLSDNGFRNYLGLPPKQPLSPVSQRALVAAERPSEGAVVTASTASTASLTLSQEAKTRFFSRVQPILQNRCSQAACHGFRSSNDLRLLEPYGQAFARISAANLDSAAAFVGPFEMDYEDAAKLAYTPALVHFATTAHGKQRGPAIRTDENILVKELLDWCNAASGRVVTAEANNPSQSAVQPAHLHGPTAAPSAPANVTRPNPGLQHVGPGGSQLRTIPDSATSNAALNADSSMMSEIDALEAELERILRAKSNPAASGGSHANSGAAPTTGRTSGSPNPVTANPADPFDASIFNNQSKP